MSVVFVQSKGVMVELGCKTDVEYGSAGEAWESRP